MSLPVRVKVCGITRLEDALDAVAFGADALGFNFWPRSKRYCSPRAARSIVSKLPPLVSAVGVFVNQKREGIAKTADYVGLAAVQLHGKETPEFCASFDLPVIKALPVADTASLRQVQAYRVAAYLLDTPSRGYGGSGRTFDWSILKWLDRRKLFILAGGLTPSNVSKAVEAVRPYGVDVASGVESAPGIKDKKKMARFIAAAKGAKTR